MGDASPAVFGADTQQAASFAVAFTNASATAGQAIAGGSYHLLASADCFVTVSTSSGAVAPSSLPATQPGSPNRVTRVAAGIRTPLDVPAGATGFFVSVRGVAASGTITFNGQIKFSCNR